MPFEPATSIPASEVLTVGQAAKRLPHLTEAALRGKIKDGIVRSIWIAGSCFLHEGDLEHSFGHRFMKRAPK